MSTRIVLMVVIDDICPAFWGTNNNAINLISLGLAVLGVFSSVFFYYKSRKKRIPFYTSRTTRLIRDSLNVIDGLAVFYDNKQLSALSITKVAFWNAGRETISSSDISGKDTLRLEIDDKYEFLSCDILSQSKEANSFNLQITEDRKTILLKFDYIDYREGVVMRIRHTGSSSEDIKIKGSIKAAPMIQRKRGVRLRKGKNPILINRRVILSLRYYVGLVSLLLVIAGFVMAFTPDESLRQMVLQSSAGDRVGKYVLSVFLIFMGSIYSIVCFSPLIRPVPKSLRNDYYGDDF